MLVTSSSQNRSSALAAIEPSFVTDQPNENQTWLYDTPGIINERQVCELDCSSITTVQSCRWSAAEGQRGYQGNCRQLGAFIHCRTCDKRPTSGGESRGRVGLIAFKQMSNLEHFDDLFYDLCGLSMYTVHVSEKGNTPNKGFFFLITTV